MTAMRKLTLAALACLSLVASTDASAATSITDRLSADHTSIEVTSKPEGTGRVHVAIMQTLAGAGVKYLDIPASQASYTPPAADPVVDVIAETSAGATIGGWAGRIQTTPAGAKEEPPPPPPPPPPSAMWVGLDTGGWVGESIAQDFSHAVKYVRSGSYNSDASIGTLAKAGVQLMPLFNSWTAGNVLAWFQRWGHGGSYWAGKTDLGATTCEVMNEPGNPYMGGERSTTDQARYARTVEEYARVLSALPAANRPRLLVSMDGGFAGDEYGRVLVKDDPNLANLGVGWTVHPYGGKSSTRQHSAEGGRTRVTESFRPVYVTEVGWPTAVGQPPTGDSQQWSESEQAANIVNFIHWARALGYVNDVTVFNFVDYGTNDFYGVETKSRVHKLSFNALAGA